MDTNQPPQGGSSQTKSRYQRVKEVLDAAAGSSTADYQGYGRFWNLPLSQFLDVEIYGIRMIAPAEEGDHCDRVMNDPDTDKPDRTSRQLSGGPARGAWTAAGAGEAAEGAGDGSCPNCHADGAGGVKPQAGSGGAGRQPPYPGRGAKSGLVQGLKGQWPFDGTQFPRLPWGGSEVSPSDILFLSDWIDDGTPETDAPTESPAPSEEAAARAGRLADGLEAHPPSAQSTNAWKQDAGELKVRKNVESLDDTEKCKLRYAVNELMKLNKYPLDRRAWNSWAQLHGDECQHGWEQFLTWHRMYLYEFEQALQDVIPEVTLPYWDWPQPIYQGGKIPPGGVSGIIPSAYRCWLNQQAIDNLIAQGVPSGIGQLKDKAFNSGIEFFRAAAQQIGRDSMLAHRPAILTQLYQVNPLWYEWRYPGMFFNPDGTPATDGLAKTFHQHYPTSEDIDQILAVDNWLDFGGGPDYNQSFGILDMNPHNTMHIWVGGFSPPQDPDNPGQPQTGDMLNNLTAAFDPIFWGHHSNVDRVYSQWQEKHPGQGPDDPTDVLPGLNFTVADAASIQKLGYEYAASSHLFPTDKTQGLTRFRSAESGAPPSVLSRFTKAEVRLHKLVQPPMSFTIRVFLNQPDADATTPIQGNDNYAGYLSIFGHGDCIGGPGHCDDQPRGARAFDRRPPHHNKPYNARLDVTKTARRLITKGASDLTVHLVAMAPDEKRLAELLRLDAVSLIFKD